MELTELSDDDLLLLSYECTLSTEPSNEPHDCLGCQAFGVWESRDASRAVR